MNFWGFRCFHCDKKLAVANHGICSSCYKLLAQTPYCGCCGMNTKEKTMSCGYCLREDPKWDRMVRVGIYQTPLSHWIHRFKFQKQYQWDKTLARLLLLAVKNAQREYGLVLPEVLIPVPLHRQRHWSRGYNQAVLIARYLAKWLNIPLDCESLQRVKSTPPQRELTAQERKRNLKRAFVYQPKQHYQRVAIIDDVVTTGSTMNMIGLELKKQQVSEIQVWTLARA